MDPGGARRRRRPRSPVARCSVRSETWTVESETDTRQFREDHAECTDHRIDADPEPRSTDRSIDVRG
ncbi:hypothetical protein BRD17_10110 [Halobacteriales archaeon SW_7_68_16]|nr:MAG: hypothetical protein BRD17_10110 [Halobacteriales archaeon SW_7_68_16]